MTPGHLGELADLYATPLSRGRHAGVLGEQRHEGFDAVGAEVGVQGVGENLGFGRNLAQRRGDDP